MNKDLNTPVWQLTAGELIDFLVGYIRPEQSENVASKNTETQHSITVK
jgi:hypothetical protein